eukprot:TRINITY_DN95962_c0_g1_i1.p1 TRINITY_DN95962_c0_g1~~TRINITY_DN95962_c0_g1_i1.p1  ORF type:complete len:375 (+),score=-3.00 TRINITY_DN95962_c0_g1_i1:77-1201(+)
MEIHGGKTGLFVGDLSSCCSEDDLHVAFSAYGIVKHVRIQRSRDKFSGCRTSAGYGFVKMGDANQAALACTALNGACIAGRNIRVRYATYHTEDSIKQESKVSLYIKFVGCTPESFTNEQIIRDVYSQFGTVEDVTIRKQFIDTRKGIKRGYAFVHYTDDMMGVESALKLLSYFPLIVYNHITHDIKFDMNDVDYISNQVVYTCSPSKNLQEILNNLQNNIDYNNNPYNSNSSSNITTPYNSNSSSNNQSPHNSNPSSNLPSPNMNIQSTSRNNIPNISLAPTNEYNMQSVNNNHHHVNTKQNNKYQMNHHQNKYNNKHVFNIPKQPNNNNMNYNNNSSHKVHNINTNISNANQMIVDPNIQYSQDVFFEHMLY